MSIRASLLVTMVLIATEQTKVLAHEPLVEPGDLVRVTAPETHSQPIEGKLHELRDTSLVVQDEWGVNREVPTRAITGLELGSKGHRGLIVGGLVGLGAGILLGEVLVKDAIQDWDELWIAPVFLGGSAIVGALIGSTLQKPSWQPVPLDQLQVGIAPGTGVRFALGTAVSF